MSDPPAPPASERRRFWCLLPLGAGAVVLLGCWTLLMLSLRGTSGCFGGYSEDPVMGAGMTLARDFDLDDFPGGFVLSIAVYIAVSLIPFLLLWASLLLARRSRSDRFLITLSGMGTALLAIYFVAGFVIAQGDLARGGMLCDLGFLLVPIGGVVLGGGIVILSAVVAWIAEAIGKRRLRHG